MSYLDTLATTKERMEYIYSTRGTGRWQLLEALVDLWAQARPIRIADIERLAARIVALEKKRAEEPCGVINFSSWRPRETGRRGAAR